MLGSLAELRGFSNSGGPALGPTGEVTHAKPGWTPELDIVWGPDHFILAFTSRCGLKPGVDEFKDLISVAARGVKLRCIIADAGYGSESKQRFARGSLASRSIFPAKQGRPPANRQVPLTDAGRVPRQHLPKASSSRNRRLDD